MKFLKLFILVPAILALGCEQESVESYRQEAVGFIKNGKNNEALITLKNALRLDEDNDYLRAMSSLVYYRLGDYLEAVSMIERLSDPNKIVLPFNPQIDDIYLLSNFQLENYEVVLTELERSPDKDLEQNEAALKYLSLLQIRRPIAAESFAKNFIRDNPSASDFQLFFKSLSELDGIKPEVQTSVALLESINDEFFEKWPVLGKLYFTNRSYERSIEAFEQYLKQFPGNKRVKIYLANSKVQTKSYEESTTLLEKLSLELGNAPIIDHMFAENAFRAKKYDEAKTATEKAIAAGFDSPMLKYIQAVSSYYLGLYEQSFDSLKAIPNIVSKSQGLQDLETLLRVRLGYDIEIKKGSKLLNSEFGENIAIALLLDGHKDRAERVLANTEELAQGEVSISRLIERAALEMGLERGDNTLQLSNTVLDLDPSNIEARLLLAHNYITEKRYDTALDVIKQGLSIDSDYIPLIELAIKASLLNKDYNEANYYSEKLSSIEPLNETALLFRVSRLIEENNFDGASEAILKYVEQAGLTINIAETYFVLAKRNQKWSSFIRLLANRSLKLSDRMRLLLVRAYIDDEQFAAAESELKSIGAKTVGYFEVSVELANAQKDKARVRRLLNEWTSKEHASPLAYITKVQLLDSNNDFTEALRTAALGVKRYPSNKLLHFTYAELLIKNGRVNIAKQVLGSSKWKNDPVFNLLDSKAEGAELLRMGQEDDAFALLLNYYKNSISPQKVSTLISLVEQFGSRASALKFIERLLKYSPNDSRALHYLADALIFINPDRAANIYKQLVKTETNNIEALNNLAWLLSSNGSLEEAEIYSTKAFQLASKNVSVRSTHGRVLLGLEKYAEAEKILFDMIERDNVMSVEVLLLYAQALVGQAREEKAIAFLESMAKKGFPPNITNSLIQYKESIENVN